MEKKLPVEGSVSAVVDATISHASSPAPSMSTFSPPEKKSEMQHTSSEALLGLAADIASEFDELADQS